MWHCELDICAIVTIHASLLIIDFMLNVGLLLHCSQIDFLFRQPRTTVQST